ncbi:MAG TPA: hypothetical protein VMM56_13975, partial [Planctomycetaceae bacterium]|nr:hypothetical protein [Planctomycetaceae bacterium]
MSIPRSTMKSLLPILCSFCWGTTLLAQEPTPIGIDDPIPVGQPPVDYESVQTSDAFAKWQAQLEAGKVELTADESGS